MYCISFKFLILFLFCACFFLFSIFIFSHLHIRELYHFVRCMLLHRIHINKCILTKLCTTGTIMNIYDAQNQKEKERKKGRFFFLWILIYLILRLILFRSYFLGGFILLLLIWMCRFFFLRLVMWISYGPRLRKCKSNTEWNRIGRQSVVQMVVENWPEYHFANDNLYGLGENCEWRPTIGSRWFVWATTIN